ncbi:hypothetical protein O4H49_03620 [Kiloniella laminariae]|uniref:Uncharacterized protein n=1 Tax=Kiloniella laminariae TaxID=454162 RepID=A0ABT4LIN1_9PROT|nr:hypothetical protein [Kiloniella laminariae]MCZ4279852.1 hypothetical protein [Kiloniella laminariae]
MSSATESTAGLEIISLLMKHYNKPSGLHNETLLGAAAALTGESALLAAQGGTAAEGKRVTEKALRLIFSPAKPSGRSSGKTVWTIIRLMLKREGIEITLPDPEAALQRMTTALNSSPFPPLSIPVQNHPREWSPNACPALRLKVNEIAARYDLDRTGKTMALGFALAYMLAKAGQMIDLQIALTLVLETMIGVAHMPPLKQPLPAREYVHYQAQHLA